MDSIASDRAWPGLVRRGSAIRNAGRVEIINIFDGNRIEVDTVEGVCLRHISSLEAHPAFAVQSVTPVISDYGGTPHLVLVLHGFTAGANTTEQIIITTNYPVVA